MKSIGAAGLASFYTGACTKADSKDPKTTDPNAPEKNQEPEFPRVPRRKLGKTGVEAPCLALGTNRLSGDDQTILRKAFQWGVTHWDTGPYYMGGNSEHSIGEFISRNPEARKKLFLASKATLAGDVRRVERLLQLSLKRMNTDYIDLYFGLHPLDDPSQLTDELRQWAEKAKRRGQIRFFGFSIHKDMRRYLGLAAKLGWIDTVMLMYNFRLMQDRRIQAAIEACHKAGIGIIAMKTQGYGPGDNWRRDRVFFVETEEDRKLVGHFLKRGFTEAQAKIKVVLQDERVDSACVGMNNVAQLSSNVAAVLDKTKLTQADMEVFREYAQATCSGYCAGCASICNSAVPDVPYVCDIMRCLMYCNSYGEQGMARELFAQIPGKVRNRLLSTDYGLAEVRCPQHLPIGKLVVEAVHKLA